MTPPLAFPLSAEVALVLACCRPASPARDAAVRALAVSVDWAAVTGLAARHRVQGLVVEALRGAGIAIPPGAGELVREARGVAVDAVRLAGEGRRLVRLLQERGVPAVVLKGAPLAMRAYGTLTTKMAWDVDLLVPPERLEDAADVLAAAGYRCDLPRGGRDALLAWAARNKDSSWHHPQRAVTVELHTALCNQPQLLAGVDPFRAVDQVPVSAAVRLPALRDDALFAYLCVHGALSGWRRAKWLADLAAWVAQRDAAALRRLFRAALAAGAGRAPAQALLLLHYLLEVPVPADLLAEAERDRWTVRLARAAGAMMSAAEGFDDPRETTFGTVPLHLAGLVLLPGARYFAGESWRKLTREGGNAAAKLLRRRRG